MGIERTEVQTLTVLNSPSLKRSQGSRLQMNTIVKSGILDRIFCFQEGSPIRDPPELTPTSLVEVELEESYCMRTDQIYYKQKKIIQRYKSFNCMRLWSWICSQLLMH